LETPVFDPKTPVFASKTLKNRFFDPKTGYYFQTYCQTIFGKFLRVRKDWIFPKNFQNLITELFRNSQKQKVWKIPSFAGP